MFKHHADELHPSVKGEQLEMYPQAAAAFNIGIMVFRPNSKAFVGGCLFSICLWLHTYQLGYSGSPREGGFRAGPA